MVVNAAEPELQLTLTDSELEFERLSAEANEAASVGDWDTALRSAEKGLGSLREEAETHLRRAELMTLVGAFEVDRRSEAQLEVSVRLLRRYLAELRNARGETAERLSAWEEATAYVAELEARLPASPSAPVPLLEPGSPSPAIEPSDDPRRSGRGLQATGGVATSVGAVLVVAGLAFAGKWSREADAYDVLRDRNASSPGSVTPQGEAAQDQRWRRARATALGLSIPGTVLLGVGVALVVVGTRRAKALGRVALVPSGVHVRF